MAEIVSFPARQGSNAQAARDLVRSIGLTGLVRTATSSETSTTTPTSSSGRAGSGTSTIPPSTIPTPLPEERGDPEQRDSEQRGGPDNGASVIPLISGSLARSVPEPEPVRPEAGTFAFLGEPDRVLPVVPQLRELLPARGLRRGSTVGAVGSAGATSLVIALLAEASRAGSWCAVVGMPTFGAAAAAEAGVVLDRVALVPHPGPEWTTIVAALLDGVDIVVAASPGPIAAGTANRLSARARQRGSVLVMHGHMPGADVVLDSTRGLWHGLDQGAGRFLQRELTIEVRGRGSAARRRSATMLMPAYAPINHDWAPRSKWDLRDRQTASLSLVTSEIVEDELLEATA